MASPTKISCALKAITAGIFSNDTQLLTPRLQPMIRYQKGGKFTPVSWDEAIRYTGENCVK